MADFCAYLPGRPGATPEAGRLETYAASVEDLLQDAVVQRTDAGGATVLAVHARGHQPVVYADGPHLFAQKGLCFNVRRLSTEVRPAETFATVMAGDAPAFTALEGTFGLMAWDGEAQVGRLLVDQTATMNLYAIEADGGLYVTTLPIPLAKALGLGLEPEGVQQFIVRGYITAPLSLFGGLRRLSWGEHAVFAAGSLKVSRYWSPITTESDISFRQAATDLASIASDRVRRYAALAGPQVFDLTSGYDSRLVVAAAKFADVPLALTVNADRDSLEYQMPRRISERLGVPLHHYVQREMWTQPITRDMRRELVCRTSGEMSFTSGYHQLLTRPELGRTYGMHVHGASVGSDHARYYAWAQEFTDIGKRQRPNLDRLLRYRFLQAGPPPEGVFATDFYPRFRDQLVARIEDIFDACEGNRNTDTLDVVHTWKNTAFISAYTSSLYGLLPTAPPINSAAFINKAVSLPVRYKVTANLVRTVIELLSPELAAEETHYGNTAEAVRLSTAPLEAKQLAKRAGHLVSKLDRVYAGGRLSRHVNLIGSPPSMTRPLQVPFDTPELRSTLDPATMATRAMYQPGFLQELVGGTPEQWQARQGLLLKVLNLELVCREVGIVPDASALG